MKHLKFLAMVAIVLAGLTGHQAWAQELDMVSIELFAKLCYIFYIACDSAIVL